MAVKQTKFSKEDFIKFMKKLGVGEEIISDFQKVPKFIKKNDYDYSLVIICRYYDIGKTYYEFELNYYSSKLMEYLLGLKIYNDIEITINHLIRELKKINQIKD